MQPLVSVIVATIGRPTLGRALDSLHGEGVEVIVAVDEREKPLPHACQAVYERGPRFRVVRHRDAPSRAPDWGNSARNAALPLARGRYVAFLDDDDAWRSEAPCLIDDAARYYPDLPVIYRMRYATGRVLWADESLRVGNVGSPMVVLPRDLALRASWGVGYTADYRYFRDAIGAATIAWRPEVIADIRPA